MWNFVKRHKKLFIVLIVLCILAIGFVTCSQTIPTIEGVVTNKYFSNEESSYVDIMISNSELVRLIFDTKDFTSSASIKISVKIILVSVHDFEGEAEALDEMIDIGDTLVVEVRQLKGHVRDVLNILAIHKATE